MVLWTMLRGPSRQFIIQLFIKKNVKRESKSWTGELKNSKLKTTLDKKPWTKKGKSGLLKKTMKTKRTVEKITTDTKKTVDLKYLNKKMMLIKKSKNTKLVMNV